MLDKLFNFLLEEHTLFMQETYLHSSNADFRKHQDSVAKAHALFELYSLHHISIDFNKKGIRATGPSMIKDFETKAEYASLEVWYKIINGSDSIGKLIMTYNRITKKRNIFSLENNMLIIKGRINYLVNLKEIGTIDENDIVASSIDGGEARLKELVNELNKHIIKFNEKLLNRAYTICIN